jgi:DNA-binding YbaB/EbfC family protein
MFKGMGRVVDVLRNMPRMREEAEQLNKRRGQITAEGDAGAGMVKVRVNGHMELTECTLSEDALKLNDREMLEDLIKGAVNQALTRMNQQLAEEMCKMVAGMGFPPGMKLPGME